MARAPNPIAFNPDTMTVSQLKEVACFARTLFQNLDRNLESNPEDVALFVQNARDDMLRKWGDAN